MKKSVKEKLELLFGNILIFSLHKYCNLPDKSFSLAKLSMNQTFLLKVSTYLNHKHKHKLNHNSFRTAAQ